MFKRLHARIPLYLVLVVSALVFSAALLGQTGQAQAQPQSQPANANIHTWANGNITYNSNTKTAVIQGEVTDKEIIESRTLGNDAWSTTVEHIYIEPETIINCVLPIDDTTTESLFGATGGDGGQAIGIPCSNLQTIISNGTVHVKSEGSPETTLGLNAMVFGDYNLKVISINHWDLEENVGAMWMMEIIEMRSSEHIPSFPNCSSIDWNYYPSSSQAVHNYSTMQLKKMEFKDFFEDYNDLVDYVSVYWQEESEFTHVVLASEGDCDDFIDSLPDDNMLYYVIPTYKSTDSVAQAAQNFSTSFVTNAHSTQEMQTFISSGDFKTAIQLPDTSYDPSIIGWATSPDATEPEIRVGQTDNLPVYGLCPLVWYEVYSDEPGPEPEPTPGTQDGWVQSDAGWQYVLNGEFLNDGWHYFEDEYGNHWYYFDSDTYIATSRWIWDDEYEGWYWLCSTGPMIENLWQWIDNAWYGFWWGGKMCQGWVWDTAWQEWYYCDDYTGRVACNEWAWDGAWYYFDQNCHMLSNCWVGDYWLNFHGMWV